MSDQDLSELVSARLCHDLISPIGAIGNGLELVQMSAQAGTEELDLISDSLNNALAKIRFFRIAFGSADPEAHLKMEEVTDITDGMYTGRHKVAWLPGAERMSRPVARIAFLAILCIEKSLPMGGMINAATSSDNISFEVEGRRITPAPELWDMAITGNTQAKPGSDVVQFALLGKRLRESGTSIDLDMGEDQIRLALKLPTPVSV